MGTKAVYEVMIALSSDQLSSCIEHVLKSQSHIRLRSLTQEEQYHLLDMLSAKAPDLILASPSVISDPLLPLLKDVANLTYTKFVAFCYSYSDAQYTKNYDAKVLATDTPEEIRSVIENTLSMDIDSEEQLLTPREKEVVIAVVKGLTNKEIADVLCLSTHTIITHRKNIARKLDIHSPSGLTIYAIMNNLVQLDDIMK